MPRSFTRSQIDRLGERLKRQTPVTADDLSMLEQLLTDHQEPMNVAQERVRSQVSESFDIAARLKSTGTIIEKLRRGTRLSGMRDIAGIRVRGKVTLDEQTALANRMRRDFGDAEIVDRRASPSYGYRAGHVIATVEDCLIEIQIRTHLQDLWAQLVEKLGDMWRRQIRYGGLPDDPDAAVPSIGAPSRLAVFEVAMTLSD